MAKKGRPSQKEIDFISSSARTKSVDEMAKALDRTTEWVKSHLNDDEDVGESAEILAKFRESPEYRSLPRKFDPEQIEAFENKYVRMLRQFKKDVLYTEESQIYMLITYELLIDKNMVKMKEMGDRIKELSLQAEEEKVALEDMEDGLERRNATSSLQNLNGIISTLILSQGRLDKVIVDYTTRIEKQWELIKGTRKDRITVIENSKRTFVDMLKSFENNKFRSDEGREMELMRIAGTREKERLGRPHKYMDGTIDRPLLSADTIGDEDIEERIHESDTPKLTEIEKDMKLLEENKDE